MNQVTRFDLPIENSQNCKACLEKHDVLLSCFSLGVFACFPEEIIPNL
jgi:hypothetical protein